MLITDGVGVGTIVGSAVVVGPAVGVAVGIIVGSAVGVGAIVAVAVGTAVGVGVAAGGCETHPNSRKPANSNARTFFKTSPSTSFKARFF